MSYDSVSPLLFCGIFTLGKVLNFFPVGGERECRPEGYHVAKSGICVNPYDCRQRDGQAAGDCAHGLGVCCTFEVTCGGVAANNLTYFMSPGFPELYMGDNECSITVEKAFAGIMQLRIDFIHFTIGQPNRMTGECDEDAMILGEGKNNFTICGQNHAQHIYYTLPTAAEAREAGELPSSKTTKLRILMRGGEMPRLWLLRIAQLPLVNSAPHGCLQYFTANNGTIKTFNFASNGRHLANQDYKACVRKNNRQCAIRYTPCDSRSFRIGGDDGVMMYNSGPGALGGPGTGFYGPDGSFISGTSPAPQPTTPRVTTSAMDQLQAPNDPMQEEDQMMEADGSQQQDEMEGSGMDPQMDPQIVTRPARPDRPARPARQESWWDTIWSFMWPSWLWGQARGGRLLRWSPYTQHYQRCRDRITIPCESEYFISSLPFSSGVCDPHHCGSSFCPDQPHHQCRVETSITPFAVTVHFGPPTVKRSPEDNIGACLRYQQLPCET
ncbi:hypothetical protein NE865_09484 [Phthorimaea operculella]|nr:hypothetical protein NE865_09484 [Phthorimaea operculella]